MKKFIAIVIFLAILLTGCASPSTIDYAADARILVETIEEVHPIFLMPEMLSEEHEPARAALLSLGRGASRQDFVFAARRYIATLQDGHMSGFTAEFFGNLLDVEWISEDNRIFLLNDEEVIKIGGVTVSDVLATVDTYFFSENEVERLRNHANFSIYETLLERAGSKIASGQVLLHIRGDGGEIRTEYALANLSWENLLVPTTSYDDFIVISNELDDFIIRHEIVDDIFIIDLRAFINGEHIDETMRYIREAIDDGIRKFIVDLRGNGGGDSIAGSRLLEAMGVRAPQFGSLRRLSDMAREQRVWQGHWRTQMMSEYIKTEPLTGMARNRHDVFISVLTDSSTYSSATMFGVWIQDGNLGNIIGSPSRNSPSAFGDMLMFTLPNSGIIVPVSYTRFLRPDTAADQSTLVPDIMVDPADALDVAIEHLRNR